MEREEYLVKHEKQELKRLNAIFKQMDESSFKSNKSLIEQAARIKALCDWLWGDIQENGTVELFTQSEKTPPYERERASAKHYANYSKLYSTIIKQLVELLNKERKEEANAKQMNIEDVLG